MKIFILGSKHKCKSKLKRKFCWSLKKDISSVFEFVIKAANVKNCFLWATKCDRYKYVVWGPGQKTVQLGGTWELRKISFWLCYCETTIQYLHGVYVPLTTAFAHLLYYCNKICFLYQVHIIICYGYVKLRKMWKKYTEILPLIHHSHQLYICCTIWIT